MNEIPFFLIVGLGNPGSVYKKTRHNIGYRVIDEFARKKGWAFTEVMTLKSKIAEGKIEEKKVILQFPLTFMNKSGEAVRQCVDYFKVDPSHLMILCDDVAIPFGQIRIKPKGSSGGHNGLKSIEAAIKTVHYPRMKIGVSGPSEALLADYVLAKFREDEEILLPDIIEKAVSALELWLLHDIHKAMKFANTSSEEDKKL